MAGYLGRQFLSLVVLLVLSSFLIYGSLFLAPGSPDAVLFGNHTVSPAVRAAVDAQYHLNEPFLVQYWHWATSALQGNFGTSIAFRTSVAGRISAVAGTTIFLVVYASVLITFFGILLGVISALGPRKLDGSIMVATNVGTAVPTFVASVILIEVFAVKLRWFPVIGAGSGFFGRLYHLTLPATALALWAVAYLTRVTRVSVRDELHSDPVMTATARGLHPKVVIARHVIRNALIPIVTVTGLQIAGLIAGTVIVEQAFGLNGLGQLLLTSVEQKDFATVQAVSLILVSAFIVTNTLVDILYTMLDPRIRPGSRQA
ncbi:MAG: ABC transporter permease [Acidimicrobiaceae bacterium]|nr:ABC transporter permease [Acidimicrobiaceae bacterium]